MSVFRGFGSLTRNGSPFRLSTRGSSSTGCLAGYRATMTVMDDPYEDRMGVAERTQWEKELKDKYGIANAVAD